jgi:hypothetical protein
MTAKASMFGCAAVAVCLAVQAGGSARAEPPSAPASAPAAQAGSAGILADARVAAIRERVQSALDRAEAKGLPSEWLLDKVAEGLAKRVPPPRIVPAVEALLARIEAADRVLVAVEGRSARATSARGPSLRAALEALTVNAPEQALVGLGRAVAARGGKPEDVRAGFTSVAELGERGFEGSAAVDAVRVAFERGGPGAWPALLSHAERIGPDGPEARVEALRGVAERIDTLPVPDDVRARIEDRLGAVGAPPAGPPSDTAFDRGARRIEKVAPRRGPPQ